MSIKKSTSIIAARIKAAEVPGVGRPNGGGSSQNYTYILRCGDGSLYTGWTNDIEKRLQAHKEGRGAKYTRGRGPLELVFLETFDTKEAAMREEYRIKHLTRLQKLQLIEDRRKQP